MSNIEKLNNTIDNFEIQVKEIESAVKKQKKINSLAD